MSNLPDYFWRPERSCTCFLGHPPCSWCTEPEFLRWMRQVLPRSSRRRHLRRLPVQLHAEIATPPGRLFVRGLHRVHERRRPGRGFRAGGSAAD